MIELPKDAEGRDCVACRLNKESFKAIDMLADLIDNRR